MLNSSLSPISRTDTVTYHYRAVERVIDAMYQQFDESLSMENMADLAFMSPYHFNRTFRQLTGIPPGRYLTAVRLEVAKRLLLTTQDRVTDICFTVGYNSLGTFVRRFTELCGLPPGRLRMLAQSQMCMPVNALSSVCMLCEAQQNGSGLSGQVTAPNTFDGLIFIGLFPTPIPQGSPVACTTMKQPGPYHISQVPDGRFYLFATGLTTSIDPNDYFLYESALRGGGESIVIQHGIAQGNTALALRPPDPLDPPILLTLPFFFTQHAEAEQVEPTHDETANPAWQITPAHLDHAASAFGISGDVS